MSNKYLILYINSYVYYNYAHQSMSNKYDSVLIPMYIITMLTYQCQMNMWFYVNSYVYYNNDYQ